MTCSLGPRLAFLPGDSEGPRHPNQRPALAAHDPLSSLGVPAPPRAPASLGRGACSFGCRVPVEDTMDR